jgi:gamma-glutamyltranspeptidase
MPGTLMQDTNVQEIGWKAVSRTGAVAAGGAKAVEAGIKILSQGGSTADAAAGTILALNVTDHGVKGSY